MKFHNTPLGVVQMPKWAEDEMATLTDEEILTRALKELADHNFRPITYSMVVTRNLWDTLENRINHIVPMKKVPFKKLNDPVTGDEWLLLDAKLPPDVFNAIRPALAFMDREIGGERMKRWHVKHFVRAEIALNRIGWELEEVTG